MTWLAATTAIEVPNWFLCLVGAGVALYVIQTLLEWTAWCLRHLI